MKLTESDIRNVVAECVRVIREEAVSKAQQRFFGMVHAYQKGEMDDASPEIKKVASEMSKKDVKDFASTKLKGLPKHVKKKVNEEIEGEAPQDKFVRLYLKATENLSKAQRSELFMTLASALDVSDEAQVRTKIFQIRNGEVTDPEMLERVNAALEGFVNKIYPDVEPEKETLDVDDEIADQLDGDVDLDDMGEFKEDGLNEEHGKKHNGPRDYMSAIRKGNRDAEMEKMGGGFKQRNKVHGMRNTYPGKRVKDSEFGELEENMSKLKAMIKESVKSVLKEVGLTQDEIYNLGVERANREKKAIEICQKLGYTNFWRYYNLLCVDLQNKDELSKVPYGEVLERGKRLQRALRSELGDNCRVDADSRMVLDNGMSVSSFAKLYI